MRFTKTRNTTRLKCCACHEKSRWTCPKCCACHENAKHLKTSQKYCACHAKRLSTRYKIRLNVTKCHACHAKRSNETFDTYKKHPSCRTYHRHGHIAIARTVANGCERLRTVANGCGRLRTVADGCGRLRTVATVNATSSEHTFNPQTPRVKREPLLRIRNKTIKSHENPIESHKKPIESHEHPIFSRYFFWFLDHQLPQDNASELISFEGRTMASSELQKRQTPVDGNWNIALVWDNDG